MKKIIVISGYLASGKSTFAEKIAERFLLPCFIKDTFKSALCKNIELHSREEKSRFSVVTFDAMMYVTECMMKSGFPLILEGNFLPAGIKKTDEAGEIQELAKKYDYRIMNIKFTGATDILYKRFVEREDSGERGEANKIGDTVSYEQFHKWCHNMDGFSIEGEVIEIDTSDFNKVDFERFIRDVEVFLHINIE